MGQCCGAVAGPARGAVMIEVDLATAFVLYLLSTLAVLFVVWVVYERGHKAPHVEPNEERIVRCPICAHLYLDDRDRRISECPQCGSLAELDAGVEERGARRGRGELQQGRRGRGA